MTDAPNHPAQPKQKVYIKTWGCQMNEYDSNRMADLLEHQEGTEVVDSAQQADLILLNTCSIRENPKEKVFSELGRLKALKEQNPNLRVGVGGCVGSQEGENILKRTKTADFVFGPQSIHKVPGLWKGSLDVDHEQPKKELLAQRLKLVDTTFDAQEKFDALPTPKVSEFSAYVSIMEGCSKYCSFCIVPYTRGEEVHRPAAEIFTEVDQLVEAGVIDIHLLGQNVNAWSHQGKDFAWLLEQVAARPGVQRLRYTTSHPMNVNASLIKAHGDIEALVPHLHLPVQSGSNKILKDMRRHYSREAFVDLVKQLRIARPGIKMSTDFIVGFPGETEEQFQESIDLCNEVSFDKSYAFIYSARPGTSASTRTDTISDEVGKQRIHKLLQVLRQSEYAHKQAMIDTVQPTLIEGFSRKRANQLRGLTNNNVAVNIDVDPLNVPFQTIGTIADVTIKAHYSSSLLGSFT